MKLFTSIFLLLTGCTLEKENTGLVRESIVETIVETTKPLEEIESVETTKKESSIIEETSSYFQRDFDTVLSNDDLILTQEEKGMNSLSKRSEDYFNTLYHCGVQDNRFLQLLVIKMPT